MLLDNFTTGINYWPINKAMYWWHDFETDEVDNDFRILKEFNLNYIRIFLTWEDFQPHLDRISKTSIDRLCIVADLADKYKLKLMPTFFCGHMSGTNWMPYWLLDKHSDFSRFPVYSNGKLCNHKIRNFYAEDTLIEAQVFQINRICKTLKGHKAIYAYDLGNETSNCCIPTSRDEGRRWLKNLTSAVRKSCNQPVTIGMHAEDLEQNRNLWPQDAGEYCDFVVMHGYPFYLNWVTNPLDDKLLAFLGIITLWLAEKPVLFQEFGVPSTPTIAPYLEPSEGKKLKCPLWSEEEVAAYYLKAITSLYEAGMIGAWAWCYGDYSPQLWNKTPLKENVHERFFGLFRHDGTAKKAVKVFKTPEIFKQHKLNDHPWLASFVKELFYLDPLNNLKKMHKAYNEFLYEKER